MKATLFSILIALVFFFIPHKEEVTEAMGYAVLLFPLLLIGAVPLVFSAAWSPLQKGEQNITPRLIEMFSQDKRIKYTATGLYLFPFISFALYMLMYQTDYLTPFHTFLIWLIFLGITIDLSHMLVERITFYFDPFKAAELITLSAKEHLRLGKLELLVDSIDALSEVSLRAIDRSNTSLGIQGISELRDIGDSFLKSSKSFTHITEGIQTSGENDTDNVSYTLFYLLTRLEMISQKAAKKGFEPTVSKTLSSFGRIAISAANYDLSLATFPILAAGRASLDALNHNMKESGIKGEIVLVEVAKAIIQENDLTYLEMKSPFLTLIDNLDQISKEIFRLDKTTNTKILIQPFLQLREIFRDPKIANHQDTPVILSEIDRTLGEYAALDAVMSARPPMPTLPMEEG